VKLTLFLEYGVFIPNMSMKLGICLNGWLVTLLVKEVSCALRCLPQSMCFLCKIIL